MTDGNSHIYAAPEQKATQYLVEIDEVTRFRVRHKARCLLWCHSCRRRRWASHLTVRVYYDATYFFCVDGQGCKKQKRRRRS
jgi:hypothetical protein